MNAPLKLSPTLKLLARLDESEWWSAGHIERGQFKRLGALLRHAHATVPLYRERLDAAGIDPEEPLTPQAWQALPHLTRRDIQDGDQALRSSSVPERFGRHRTSQSSGSTGEPVKVVRTQLEEVYWRALTLRDHRWHGRDLDARLCAIRAIPQGRMAAGGEFRRKGWGPAADLLGSKGSLAMIPLATGVRAQTEWLLRHDPDYLLTYPSNALALADEFERQGVSLSRLRELRTVGETLTAAAEQRLRAAWKVPVVDLYSSEEVGLIALKCPSGSGLYHVQAESVKVEVLDEAGRPCAPGGVGRVIVSSLHNFAMPLLRYELRDYAEAGPACPCGRGLPALARILGRQRNMLVLPDGERQWPLSGAYEYRDIAPIRRSQMVQLDLERIEMRMVADRPVSADEERRLAEVIQRWIGHPFKVEFKYLDDFPATPGGKFEDFISMVES
jgi:phenylacetate-CoA ligase